MMWPMTTLVDFILHVETHLQEIVQAYGVWTYLVLALIIFCETGLVVTPILPGDSLLFAAGAMAAQGALNVSWLTLTLSAAAVAGDAVNYWVGYAVGPRVFLEGRRRLFKREHLERTHRFYERHGGKTIVLARFMPIVRTFAPFVAGIGKMTYRRFAAYNVIGGLAWIATFVLGGYAFGNLPMVKRHFTWVIVAIVILSVLPVMVEALRHRRRRAEGPQASPAG